jgi:membrane-bound serine protease (ClpP class)
MLHRFFVFALLFLLLTGTSALAQPKGGVVLAKVDGAIMPPTHSYLQRALQRAEREHAELLLIEMNTPGGALGATRDIAGLFIRSSVPVVVYVTPSGARAGSAGAIVSLAAHVVAMAPGTNIGAAHPVNSNGANIERDMRDKVTNDAAALARSLAESRGRSVKWAGDIIRLSVSSTEREALQLKVADLIASDRADLLRQLEGRTVSTSAGNKTLRTAGAVVAEEGQTWTEGLLGFLYNPNIAMILFVLAIYGLVAELNTPGATLPGVVGAICLILALFAASVLSISVTGAILLILSVTLFVMDLYTPTHGVLTVGGLIAFVVGSLLLFDPGAIGVGISVPVVITLAIMTALFFGLLMGAAIRSTNLPPGAGPETIVGMTGDARSDHDPSGSVFVDGALWDSLNVGADPIRRGDRVVVQALNGLTLEVKRAAPQQGEPIWSKADNRPEPPPSAEQPTPHSETDS